MITVQSSGAQRLFDHPVLYTMAVNRVSCLEYGLLLTMEYLPVAGGELHIHVLFPGTGAVHSHHFKWVAS